MRSRPTIWILLCLLAAVAAWLFWHGQGRDGSPSRPQQTVAPAGRPYPASNFTSTQAASTAPLMLVPKTAATNSVARNNPLTYRLNNTGKTIGQLLNDPHAILLQNAFIDASAGVSPSLPKNLQAVGDPGAYIVQASGKIDGAFRAMLAAAGAQIISYIPNNAYLVRLSAGGAGGLSGRPEVQAVVPYEPYYKISMAPATLRLAPSAWVPQTNPPPNPSLLELAVEQRPLPKGTQLRLGLFGDDAAATLKQIEKLGATVTAKDRSPFGPVVQVRPPADWTSLAQLSGVQIVEPYHPRKEMNDLSRVALGISGDTQTTTNYMNLTGKNVLVEVNDSGIDAGHPDFNGGGNPRVSGDSPLSLIDTEGHGTHVAGIIAGDGTESTTVSNAQGSINPGVLGQYRGKAPDAELYSVGFLGDDPLAVSDQYLQETPALTNALISNNSWGVEDDNEYDLVAASYDAAVRDAVPEMTGSQPVLFVFSAGNNGDGDNDGGGGDSDSISSPATAKDVITVGALEEPRYITNVVTTVVNGVTNLTEVWYLMTDSSSQVAEYSSRGNVGIGTEGDYGRFKPDVVAPGSFVISTRSGQWDEGSYYSPTNYYTNEFSGVLTSNSFNSYLLSLSFFPPNTTFNSNIVGINIEIVPNIYSPTNFPILPIYVSQLGPPDPADSTTYDFAKYDNMVSIPPDGGGNYLSGLQEGNLFYTIENTNNEVVNYDVITEIIATNQDGNYFQVLSNLNDSIGTGTAPYSGGYYRYESGTSMAAAAISGVLALMQDYFTNVLHTVPSPALLKAMLINGSRPVGNYNLLVTNSINYQGWGLPNLPDSLPPGVTNQINAGCSSFFVDQSPINALATGDSHTYDVMMKTTDPAVQSQPLRVTLAWTDPPGDPAAAIKLVNNLDLVVSNKDTGVVYYGNDISAGNIFNSAGNTNNPNFDSINNVENVFLPSPGGTNFAVTVIGRDVNVNAVTAQTNNSAGAYAPNVVQDYALVISSGDGQITNAFTVADGGVVSAPTSDQDITIITATNTPYLNQFVGANTPLLGTNTVDFAGNSAYATNAIVTIGMTNQWHFYVVTNNGEMVSGIISNAPNAAFITFIPNTLSVPRMGVYQENNPDNATRPEADIDEYVSTDPTLTNLNPVVISNCVNGTQVGASSAGMTFYGASLSREGTEFVVDTNSSPGQVYYVGVKSEDQNASEYGFISIFSATPFSQMQNGNEIVNGLLLPVAIPDGSPAHPGVAYIFGLAIYPMNVGNVAVYNQIAHQNFGDLIGVLGHNGTKVVLNNHDSLGPVTNSAIYDDSGSGQFPGSKLSDGPGSLLNFIGQQAIGPWILKEVDDSLTQTGAVTGLQLTIQPHRDLKNGIDVFIPPNSWFYDYVDVPVGYTNLTVSATNLPPPVAPPLQMFVEPGRLPTLADTNGVLLVNGTPPGNSISLGPPLEPGRYFVGIYNSSSSQTAEVYIIATILFSQSAISYVNYNSVGPVPILDDAVITNSIVVTNTDIIQDFSIGLRVDHPRISDLVFHLISPDGTRYLLMENRGGTSTNGCGVSITSTNFVPVSSNGSDLPNTNSIDTGQTSGTFTISYNMYTLPDEMVVQYQGTTLWDSGFISGSGTTNFTYSGSSSQIAILMNPNGNPDSSGGDLWNYTVSSTQSKYYYLAFTEDTNLTTTPIKFAPPPFVPDLGSNYTAGFESAVAGDYAAPTIIPSDKWSVLSNQVSVVADPTNAAGGNQFLALANGTISNTLATVPGKSYYFSFAYRGPGAVSLWPADGNANDVVSENNGTPVNGANYASGYVSGGQAFQFSGTQQKVQIGDPDNLKFTNSFSFDAWVYLRNYNTTWDLSQIIDRSDDRPCLDPYNFGVLDTGQLRLHVEDDVSGTCGVDCLASGFQTNQWEYVAGTFDGNTGTMKVYINGVLSSLTTSTQRPFQNLDTNSNPGVSIGDNYGSVYDQAWDGWIDNLTAYSRALSASEIQAIYQKGSAGKFDPSATSVAQGLAEAALNLSGTNPVSLSGNNTSWQTYAATFTATQNSTPLTIAGLEPGMLLDNFSMFLTPTNLYYQPEQDMSALNGQSAAGTWTLEVQDDRAGAGLTNSLVSWQLQFTFANTNSSSSSSIITLTNMVPYTNSTPVLSNGLAFYQVNVPLNADYATNLLLSADAPLNIWWSTNFPPTITNAADVDLIPASMTGSALLGTNGSPVNTTSAYIVPGGTYYLVVENPNTFAVTNYTLEVDFHLIGQAYAYTEPATLVTGTNAQFNGFATPNGYPSTAWFQWGTNTFYGNQTPPVNVGNGYNVFFTTSQISGLITNTAYHFRLVVSNILGTVYGFDQILDEANVIAWGANYSGQLYVPTNLNNVVRIAGAYDHNLAIGTNALVTAWGDNAFGQATVPASLSNAVAVAGGQYYSLALKSDGTVTNWGANILGALNSPTNLNSVVEIAGGTYSSLALRIDGSVVAWGAIFPSLTNIPPKVTNIVAVSGGGYHSLALKNDGTVIAWGDDSVGQTNIPPNVTNVVAIAAGSFHNLALRADGTVVAWGDDSVGQTNVPPSATNVVAIAAGGFHNIALKANGNVVTWGDNSAGQLSVPVGLTNIVAVAAGYLDTLVLTPQLLNSNITVLAPLTPGMPVTNSILPGGINYYPVIVPTNADIATNSLLYAQNGPLNVWYTTNTPAMLGATNATLLINGTNGVSILYTNGTPPLVPGSTYYLGVQNTNTVTVNYAVEVDFHYLTSTNQPTTTNFPIVLSITQTNIGATNGFLLTWYAPTNDIFMVQQTPTLAPINWQSFSNIISYPTIAYITRPPVTNGIGFFEFFDDGSQFPFTNGLTRFYRVRLLNVNGGTAQTNTVSSNSISLFAITVPTNADFATNILLSASAPVNLLFNQTAPPTGTNAGDYPLLLNSTNGTNVLSLSSTPPLVPGQTYFLGVQNTNNFAVTFSLVVEFHLSTNPPASNPISVSSVTFTNNGVANGFLLTWYAPTDDVFQVQYADTLSPLNWQFFTNFISYTGPPTLTNGLFSFFDDGSQTPPGLPAMRFYRIILVGSTPSLHTNAVPISSVISTNVGITNGFLVSWSAPTNYLFEVQWTTNLGPILAWQTFPNIVSYSTFVNPTNSLFDFFDDGSQGGLAPLKFYRLLLLP